MGDLYDEMAAKIIDSYTPTMQAAMARVFAARAVPPEGLDGYTLAEIVEAHTDCIHPDCTLRVESLRPPFAAVPPEGLDVERLGRAMDTALPTVTRTWEESAALVIAEYQRLSDTGDTP